MVRKHTLHPLLAIISLMSLVSFACRLPATTPNPYQAAADGMKALTAGLSIPENLRQEVPIRSDADFDVMGYFTVLDHLSMEPGYVLDYAYHRDGMGAYPLLYNRAASTPRYLTEAEYSAATTAAQPERTRDERLLSYLDHIQTDGTEEAYFQLAVLAMLGRQFYLDWHANYNDATPICSRQAVWGIVMNRDLGFGQHMPLKTGLRALQLDPKPRVATVGEETRVSFLYFTKWGGFYQVTYSFLTEYPHQLVSIEDKLLVEFKINVMF